MVKLITTSWIVAIILVGCSLFEPMKPEEKCIQISNEIENESGHEWPTDVIDVAPLGLEPLLCKGTATFKDESVSNIQFYRNSEELGFEAYLAKTCEELAEQIILNGISDTGWPAELTNLVLLAPESHQRIACKATTEYGFDNSEDSTRTQIVIYQSIKDSSAGFESIPISYLKCNDDAFLENILVLSEEMNQSIIKIYDPVEISNNGERLNCRGRALWQKSSESVIDFYIYQDKDGDQIFGYEEM